MKNIVLVKLIREFISYNDKKKLKELLDTIHYTGFGRSTS